MADCSETNAYFENMADQAHDFFDQDGWRDIVSANYNAQKDLVDQEFAFMNTSYEQGIYFNAGMFYGRTWYYLAYGQWI